MVHLWGCFTDGQELPNTIAVVVIYPLVRETGVCVLVLKWTTPQFLMMISGMCSSNVMWRTMVSGGNAQSILRSSPEPGSDVGLYFGGEEYEGLLVLVPSNTYPE